MSNPVVVATTAKALRFKDLDFGMASADSERAERPELLLHGYLDEAGFTDQVLAGSKYLILGPKGSGKSAIGARIELLSSSSQKYFARSYQLENFPYEQFSGLFHGKEAPEIRLQSAWEFVILLAVVESLSRDKTAKGNGRIRVESAVEGLEKLGLLPSENFTELVKKSVRKETKLAIPKWFSKTFETSTEPVNSDYGTLLRALQEVCYSITSSKKHYILIDGLDDVMTKRQGQFESLAALIVTIDRMNKKFKTGGSPIVAVAFCRTDLLDKLQSPNKNKIRQDHGLTLDWYQDTHDLGANHLTKLVNLRASNSAKKPIDIFRDFLPSEIRDYEPTMKTIMEHTRHLPRDLIMLLNKIQNHTKLARPLREDVLNGLREYSTKHLLPEIRDELLGFLEPDQIERGVQLLTRMRKRRFSYADLVAAQKADAAFKNVDPRTLCERLFETNAIGNMFRDGVKERFTFKFRNPASSFDPNGVIVVHAGLCKALNLG